jgi:hypothetical protein
MASTTRRRACKLMVLGPTIAETWDDLYYLERACQVQCLARSMGRKVLPVDRCVPRRPTSGARRGRPSPLGSSRETWTSLTSEPQDCKHNHTTAPDAIASLPSALITSLSEDRNVKRSTGVGLVEVGLREGKYFITRVPLHPGGPV